MQQTIDNLLSFFRTLVEGFASSTWLFESKIDFMGQTFTPLTMFTITGLSLFVSTSIVFWFASGVK